MCLRLVGLYSYFVREGHSGYKKWEDEVEAEGGEALETESKEDKKKRKKEQKRAKKEAEAKAASESEEEVKQKKSSKKRKRDDASEVRQRGVTLVFMTMGTPLMIMSASLASGQAASEDVEEEADSKEVSYTARDYWWPMSSLEALVELTSVMPVFNSNHFSPVHQIDSGAGQVQLDQTHPKSRQEGM